MRDCHCQYVVPHAQLKGVFINSPSTDFLRKSRDILEDRGTRGPLLLGRDAILIDSARYSTMESRKILRTL